MTIGLPQQRQHPGEGAGKCNPERDARPPMFPNQVDPPPQRPWPATSDEGNSVPAPAVQRPLGDQPADTEQQSWTVLVQDGIVVSRYRAEDAHQQGVDLTRITLAEIDMYEIHTSESQAPHVGDHVDPAALGWSKLG